MRAIALSTVLLTACWSTPSPPDADAPPAKTVGAEAPSPLSAKAVDQPLVMLIVMDTVRADHMSMCGYERPTTPFLERFVAEQPMVSHTCDAVAPGTWTIPSHTSFFTGLDVPAHGNDSAGLSFPDTLPTLAETMKDRGYKTVLVSANPTLSKSSGLQRGFDTIGVSPHLDRWRGPRLAVMLDAVLRRVDKDQPLFIVVNILDAHDPYPEVPEGLDWVPARSQMRLHVHEPEANQRFHRFVRGELTEAQGKAFTEAITDGYDYGIHMADSSVERVFGILQRHNLFGSGLRVVITSDHGEFLGEHQTLRHGCYAMEPVSRVPLIYFDPSRSTPLDLPSPISGRQVFHLLRDGALAPDIPAAVTSKARVEDIRGCADMAAIKRTTTDKVVWRDGDFHRYDLGTDPDEASPTPLAEDDRADIAPFVERHQAHLETVRAMDIDEARAAELKALGYME